MTNVLLKNGERTTLETIVVADDIDISRVPRRGYDFNKGDRRFQTREAAITHADNEARRTGVRQVVRLDSTPHFVTLYVVQAVGS